jgi:single-strand DNA-binding protein
MAGYSKVIVVGNLGQDPETRYTPSGAMNVRFSLAVNRRFRDSSGQDQERTTWFRVTAWGRLAETLDGLSQRGYVTKGKQVLVEGRIELNEWTDQQNEKRASLEVTANEFQLLGTRADTEQGGESFGSRDSEGGGRRQQGNQESESFDDVPF